MPQFDMTGPEGRGPMTGRRMGICVDRIKPLGKEFNNENVIQFNKGLGRRFGFKTRSFF